MNQINTEQARFLEASSYERWLGPEPDPHDLLITYPSEPLTMWPISTRVNAPENDDPSILDRIADPFDVWAGYLPSALAYLDDFPLEHVGEIHLSGHAEQTDDEGDILLIDGHDGPVADAVWKLFDIVIGRSGPIPTLVEWDSDIPDWPVLKSEAVAAQAILDRYARSFMPGTAHAAR